MWLCTQDGSILAHGLLAVRPVQNKTYQYVIPLFYFTSIKIYHPNFQYLDLSGNPADNYLGCEFTLDSNSWDNMDSLETLVLAEVTSKMLR